MLQRVIDAFDSLVVVVSPDCSLWLWNRRCDDTAGVPLAEAAGRPIWSVVRLPSKLRPAAEQAVDRLLAGEERSVEFLSLWLRKDGRKARVAWTARLVDWGDDLRFIVATGVETTRGHRVAREIAETESRFETLLEVLPDPVIVHQDGRVVFANRAAAEMYRAGSVEDLLGLSVMEFVAQEHRGLVLDRMTSMRETGQVVPMAEESHLRLDGSGFDVEVVAAPVTFDGHPAIELVARDITTRKTTEAALRASEARVRAVFDQSSLGMLLVDRDGRSVETNAAFRRLLGYDAAELGRLTVADYTHPADVEASVRLLRDLFAGRNDGYELEKRYVTRGGLEIWVRVHVSPVRDGSGVPEVAVGTVEDITAHKTLEDQLRQSSKMEALGRLAGGVAHDFRNTLQAVLGFAELLVDSLEGDERAADAVQIREAALRATELTDQLLAFGRPSKRAQEPVDLNCRIEAMAPMLRRLLSEDIDFATRLDQSVGSIDADPSQLDQVVMNLVVNGRDAMPAGGSLTVSTRAVAPGGVVGRGGAGKGWVRLEIADSGTGMDPETLEHIFEPFFTTKTKGRGTGLGLATVYRIVQQMGGRVWAESSVGLGSRFVVELPQSDALPTKADAGGNVPAPASRTGGTVLLVEDEPFVRDFCRRALLADGYLVHAAGPREALAAADSIGSSLDILVTDVVMPDFDGPTIAAALRSRRSDLRILFISGYPRDLGDELAGPAAAGAVLPKPFTQRELCDAVRRALDRPAPAG